MGFERRFADFGRDLRNVLAAVRARFPRPFRLEANHQIQVLSSPFFRNQTAYIVGRVVNGISTYPFVVPVKHDADGKLYFDALLMDDADLAILFSANRAYFLVDMEVPSAYVELPARHLARQDRRRALHDGRAAEGRQELLLSATSCTISSTRATSSSSRRASRAW